MNISSTLRASLQKKVLVYLVSFVFSLQVLVIPASATTTPPSPTTTNVVVINPDSLRQLLLEQSIDLSIQLNNVYKAKSQVSISRARLLPSINLGAMLSGVQGFALSSVSMLLPFLLPSNWLNLEQSKYLLEAQVKSYYIGQLNAYSSAYSLYLTIVGDINLRNVLYKQYVNYKEIEDVIALAVEAGMMNEDQLLQARAQTQLSSIQVSQLDALIIEEKSSIREMLALPLSKNIEFEVQHIEALPSETLPLQSLVDKAQSKAPELAQLKSLVSAAEVAKWSAAFGFLNSMGLGANRTASGFDAIPNSGSISLGFSNFPQIKLASYNIKEIKLQQQQLTLAQTQLIESTIGTLAESEKQLQLAVAAEKNLQKFYEGEVEKFKAGMTSLLSVLNAGKNLTQALTAKVNAQIRLDTLRVGLHRILLEGKFTKISPCIVERRTDDSFWDRLGRVITLDGDLPLDKACGPQSKH